MLEIDDLSVSYGGLAALRGVSLSVAEGQFVAIVGPNGAGKTTLFKAISGTVRAGSRADHVRGARSARRCRPRRRAHLGIAHVPEGRQVFAALTVLENLEMGAYSKRGRDRMAAQSRADLRLFPVLAERRRQLAGTLSGGEQQMLAIGRGIASSPRLLLLDEPSMGLAPSDRRPDFRQHRGAQPRGKVTLVLVEQRVAEALEILRLRLCAGDRPGRARRRHETLMADDRVRRAYLGM